MIGQPSAFWRKSVHEKIGYFDESLKMAADFDFFVNVGIQGNVLHTPQILASLRLHKASLSSTFKKLNRIEVRLIQNKYLSSSALFKYGIYKFVYSLQFKLINFESIYIRLKQKLRFILSPS
jgi:hypothetical protein